MAAMSATLYEFSTNGDSRTFYVTGHTVAKPKLVIQKRKVPTGNQTTASMSTSVIYGASNAAGEVLPSKIALEAACRWPVDMTSTDRDAAIALYRDFVASDAFVSAISAQAYAPST